MTPTPEALARKTDPLIVEIVDDRLIISIGISTLAFAVIQGAGREAVMHITDEQAAAADIVTQLRAEDEDGTTAVHRLLDTAAWDAWENGGLGFDEPPVESST